MDPVTLIAAAMAAGAAAGATDVATRVVTDGYQGLRNLLTRRYGAIEAEIVSVERDPQEPLRRELLTRELGRSGAGENPEVRAAAEDLLRMVAEQAPAAVEAVGVTLVRVEAGGDIEISDIIGAAPRAVEAADVSAGGSIRISGVRTGRHGSPDPPAARG